MIDRYLLRYFLAVLDCGSFSRAAAQVNVAQPTLSVGIAKLERLLGAKLFERTSQRVHLTEAGTRLAAHARRIESEFNLAEAAMLGVEPARVIRLGVLATIPTAALGALAGAAGDGRLELVEGTERSLLQRLARGRIDVALTLVRADADRFAQEPLWSEGYRLALPAGHRLAGEESVAAEALAGDAMIVRRHCEALAETSRHFTERGVRPFLAFKTTNDDRALALVKAGLGVTMMPEAHAMEGVARPLLTGFAARRTIGLVWAAHAEPLRHAGGGVIDALRMSRRS